MNRRLCLAFLVGTGASLAAPPVAKADAWARVRSPHFEVLSDAGEAPAEGAARRLERLRTVLLKLFPGSGDPGRLITVLVVQDRGRFVSLVPRERLRVEHLGGFFQGGGERDYAVLHLSPQRRRPFEAVEHEYAHLVLNRSLQAQPVWISEGLADVLSGAVLTDGQAFLGAARAEYEPLLSESTLPLAALLDVGYDSPEYMGEADSGPLYARSWALVRWVIHREGLEALRGFAEDLAAGQEARVAFAQRIGDLAAAEASLSDVPAGPVLRVSIEPGPEPTLRKDVPPAADVEHRLGDLLLHGGHGRIARHHFEAAILADPGHLASRAGLGGLLVSQGEWGAARRELEAVLEADPDNPTALLRHARLLVAEALERGVPLDPRTETRAVADLERALVLSPQLYEAALLLASLSTRPRANLIELLEPLFEQQPDRTDIARTLSQLYVQAGDLTAARRVLRRARDAARNPAYRYLCGHLLARLEGFSAATVELHGDLIYLDCRPDGSLRFTVAADPANVKLEAASTRSFFVHGTTESEPQAEFVCGYQDRPIVVRFHPAGRTDPAVDGKVLWLALDSSPRD